MRPQLKLFAAALTAGVLAVAAAPAALADPNHYTDEATFDAQGEITQTTSFTGIPGDVTYLPNPLTIGGLIINTGDNIVVGPGSSFGNTRGLVAYNYQSPFSLAFNGPGYDLLGFRVGNLFGDAGLTLRLDTNLDVFFFELGVPLASDSLAFHGFKAPTGQYFTSALFTVLSEPTAPGFTDIQIGHADAPPPVPLPGTRDGAVPEPSAWALLIIGFGGVGAALRRRRLSRLVSA